MRSPGCGSARAITAAGSSSTRVVTGVAAGVTCATAATAPRCAATTSGTAERGRTSPATEQQTLPVIGALGALLAQVRLGCGRTRPAHSSGRGGLGVFSAHPRSQALRDLGARGAHERHERLHLCLRDDMGWEDNPQPGNAFATSIMDSHRD